MEVVREYAVGDRLVSLSANLYKANGDPLVLAATDTVAFRMIKVSDASVKVNNQGCTVVTVGSAATSTPAQVRYDWAAADVDTAGEYAGWFIRTSLAGTTEHFPAHDHADPKFKIVFYADT